MSVAEFKKIHEHFQKLRKEGKIEETFSYFTEDCHVMSPLAPPFPAKDMAKVANNPKLADLMKAESITTVDEVKVMGDLAADRGHFVIKHPDGDKKGSYLAIWKKVGDSWKIASGCWNIQILDL